ncbi:MAG: rhodanese family protein [Rhodospirillales bacterium]|nr:rhodanese family protein [Rhodospirillales bacterium]
MLKTIDATTAKTWVEEDKAVLIDIREADEHAREHILGARLAPLSRFGTGELAQEGEKIAVFHCDSGNRTRQAAPQILSLGFEKVYHLEGGLQAWKRAGLPVELNRKAPISLMRQVQIATGSLVLLGVLLGLWASPWFLGLSAFVGAGLAFAGLTGFCGMARLLAVMPWNQRAAAAV